MAQLSYNAVQKPPLPGFTLVGNWIQPDNATEESGFLQGGSNVLSQVSIASAWQRSMMSTLVIPAGASFSVLLTSQENTSLGLYTGAMPPATPAARYSRDKHGWVGGAGASSNFRPHDNGLAVGLPVTYGLAGSIPWVMITCNGVALQYKYSYDFGVTWILHYTSLVYSPLDTYRIDLVLRYSQQRGYCYYKPSYTA